MRSRRESGGPQSTSNKADSPAVRQFGLEIMQKQAQASEQQQQQQGGPASANDKQNDKKKKKRKHSFDSIFSFDSELDEFDTQAVRFKPESLENLVKLTKFNKRELKLMYRGFKQLCPSGVVKEDKFKLIYAQFFPRGAETNGYARLVFNSFDVQRKQELTFNDFVLGLSVLTRGSTDEQLRWIFTLYDVNADGVITRDELHKVVGSIFDLMGRFALSAQPSESRPMSPSAQLNTSSLSSEAANQQQQLHSSGEPSTPPPPTSTESQADCLFRKLDLNNDGVITLDEFIEACHKDENIIKSISVFNTIL